MMITNENEENDFGRSVRENPERFEEQQNERHHVGIGDVRDRLHQA